MSAVEAELRAALTQALRQTPSAKLMLGDPPRIYEREPSAASRPYAVWARLRSERESLDGHDLLRVRATLALHAEDRDAWAILSGLSRAVSQLDIPPHPTWRLLRLNTVYSEVFQTRGKAWQRGLIQLRALVSDTGPP